MAIVSARVLRPYLVRLNPSVSELDNHERFAVLASSSWIDEVINKRVDDLAYIAEYARSGKICVEVSYRSSGWGGIDDASVHHYTIPATLRAYREFMRELREDCDGCDAFTSLISVKEAV